MHVCVKKKTCVKYAGQPFWVILSLLIHVLTSALASFTQAQDLLADICVANQHCICITMATLVIAGLPLEVCRKTLHACLQVDRAVASGGCIVCAPSFETFTKRANPAQTHYSEAGQKEYARSGCCEVCFDLLTQSSVDRPLHAMTGAGAAAVRFWLHVGHSSKCLRIPRAMSGWTQKLLRGHVKIHNGPMSPDDDHMVLPDASSNTQHLVAVMQARPAARPAMVTVETRRADPEMRAVFILWYRWVAHTQRDLIFPDCVWCGLATGSFCDRCGGPLCPPCNAWCDGVCGFPGCI